MPTISAEDLLDWSTRLLEAWGYPRKGAAFIAGSLVDANLRGVDSHGVIRLPPYEARITHGLVDPKAEPVVQRSGAVVTVDAAGAAGQLAALVATEEVSDLAGEFGVATATVKHSAHFGAAGYYARMLADRGQIGLVLSNSEPVVVPHGGREALFGTNPFAFAAPAGDAVISLDMATSTVAMGKVLLASSRHESIPADWGVDEAGTPTTDPDAVRSLLPMSGPKGYGISVMIEVLAGVLSGAAFGTDLGAMYDDFSKPQNIGHWMLAIDVEHFMPRAEFEPRMAALIGMVRSSTPLDPERPVLLPGEPEDRIQAQRERDGIPIPDDTRTALAAIGERYGAPFPG
jgi:LDH2 family malate/lactate/ureidoglycolate dehydrogenase